MISKKDLPGGFPFVTVVLCINATNWETLLENA